MALKVSKETEFGVEATYWNIGAKAEDYFGKGNEVVLFGFLNEDARKGGKKPLGTIRIQVNSPYYIPDMNREAIYNLMKSRPEFENSENC